MPGPQDRQTTAQDEQLIPGEAPKVQDLFPSGPHSLTADIALVKWWIGGKREWWSGADGVDESTKRKTVRMDAWSHESMERDTTVFSK